MIYVMDQGVWKEVGGGKIPYIGEPFEGGYLLSVDVKPDSIEILIIADKSAEASLQWKTSNTSTSGTSSQTDGWANTNAMNNTSHPAAKYCRDYRGGGFSDWYLPAKSELNLFWLNIAPGNSATPIAFQTGGAQALAVPTYYWSSTENSALTAWRQRFSDGSQNSNGYKDYSWLVRPVRRLIL